MQQRYFPLAFLLLAAWCGLTGLNPNNPPLGRTGAPGETTCGASGCHTGGMFTGTVALSGVPDTVQPGQTYALTLTHTSNATRAGFQLTALDSLNAKAGTLTAGTGVNVASNNTNGRQYARQSSPKTLSGGSTSWTFNWQAPTTATGPIRFYIASLAANGNGARTGDNPLTASPTVRLAEGSVSTQTPTTTPRFDLYPNPATDVVHLALSAGADATVRIYDLTDGRVHLVQRFTGNTALDVRSLPAGAYSAVVEWEGKRETRRWVKK